MTRNTKAVTADDLRRLYDEVWNDTTTTWYYRGLGQLTHDGERRLKSLYKAARAVGYGFTPHIYTGTRLDFLLSHAECAECGHKLSLYRAGWMRTHAATKHGRNVRESSFPDVFTEKLA